MKAETDLHDAIAEHFAARPPVVAGRCRAVDVGDGAWVMLTLVEAQDGFTRRVRAAKKAARALHAGILPQRAIVQGGSMLAVAVDVPADAETLTEAVAARGPLAVDEVRALAADLCAALAHAHAAGVVHGSLDGWSVVLGADGWQLTDLAGAAARNAVDEPDERADVRGVGAILFEAATGKPPFEAPPLSLPTELRATILRCLQRDPERRYGRVEDVAAALGVGAPRLETERQPRPRGRRGLAWLAALAVVAGLGAVATWRFHLVDRIARLAGHATPTAPTPASPTSRPVLAPASAPASQPASQPVDEPAHVEAAPAPRILLAVNKLGAPAGDHAWLGRGVTEMLVAQLDDVDGLEVLPPPFDTQVIAAAARAGSPALLVGGTIEPDGDGVWLNLRVVDARTNATVWAERSKAVHASEILADVEQAGEKIRRQVVPHAKAGRGVLELTTSSAPAFAAYVDGLVAFDKGDLAAAEKAWRRAAGIDPHFFHPRARLVDLGVADAPAILAEARPLAAHAGVWGDLTIRRLEAKTPAERVAALAAVTARYPRDAKLAAQLAAAYRAAGRAGDCVSEGERADALGGTAADVDLVWCRFESGDEAGAYAAAKALHADPTNAILAGDLALMMSRWSDARADYRIALDGGDKRALARLALVSMHADGKCKGTVHASTEEDARIWAATSLLCGDFSGVRDAEAFARHVGRAHAGDEIAAQLSAVRYDKAAYPELKSRAADASRWSAEGLDRARRYGPLLATARAAGKASEALAGLSALPIDRHPWFEWPLLYDVAMAKVDVGDAEDALLLCQEIMAAAPAWVPGHYCLGRAAEGQKDYAAAYREYRELLDRWSDADADNRITHDAKRRIVDVARKAQAASASRPAAPASQPAPPPVAPFTPPTHHY